jgi:hypothetical protein
MLNQFENLDPMAILGMMTGAALIVVLVFIVIYIIVILKVWAWAINKRGGRVEGLGQVFVTLLIGGILGGILSAILQFALAAVLINFDPMMALTIPLLIGGIVGFVIEVVVISKRHDMSFGEALIACILAAIIFFLIAIAITIVLVLILMFALGVALM